MHNLFSVYFVNLYRFRAYLNHHQELQLYVYNNWYLLFFFKWLSVFLVGQKTAI